MHWTRACRVTQRPLVTRAQTTRHSTNRVVREEDEDGPDSVMRLVQEGRVRDALEAFVNDSAQKTGARTLIKTLGSYGDAETCMHVYHQFSSKSEPDVEILVTLLDTARRHFSGNVVARAEKKGGKKVESSVTPKAFLEEALAIVLRDLKRLNLIPSSLLLSNIVMACNELNIKRFSKIPREASEEYILSDKVDVDTRLCATFFHSLRSTHDIITSKKLFAWMCTCKRNLEIFGEYVYGSLFMIAGDARDLEFGRTIQCHLNTTRDKYRWLSNPQEILRTNTAMIWMYGRCLGSPESLKMLRELAERKAEKKTLFGSNFVDIVLYNTILSLCLEEENQAQERARELENSEKPQRTRYKNQVRSGDKRKEGARGMPVAKEVWKMISDQQVPPNEVTFITLLNLCAATKDLDFGEKLHESIREISDNERKERECEANQDKRIGDIVKTSIVTMEKKTFNAILKMRAKCKSFQYTIDFLRSRTTAPHEYYEIDESNWSVLLSLAGTPTEVWETWSEMKGLGFEPDVDTWKVLFETCAQFKSRELASALDSNFHESQYFISLKLIASRMKMHAKCESPHVALDLLRNIKQSIVIDPEEEVAAYNTILRVCYEEKTGSELVREIWKEMKDSEISKDISTCITLLYLFGQLRFLEEGKEVHECLLQTPPESLLEESSQPCLAYPEAYSALVLMYAHCLKIDELLSLLPILKAQIREPYGRRLPVNTWNFILRKCLLERKYSEGVELFEEMRSSGVQPDIKTFTTLIQIITKSGNVEEAKKIHGMILTAPDTIRKKLTGPLLEPIIKMYANVLKEKE